MRTRGLYGSWWGHILSPWGALTVLEICKIARFAIFFSNSLLLAIMNWKNQAADRAADHRFILTDLTSGLGEKPKGGKLG